METITQTTPYVIQFEEFFNSRYRSVLERLAAFYPDDKSIEVDYKKLEEFDTDLADELIQNPYIVIKAAQEAVSQLGLMNPQGEKVKLNMRFVNLPADSKVLLRNITSEHIDQFMSIDGLVTTVSESRPKIVNAVFECRHCGRVYNIEQTDQSGKLAEPASCACERKNFNLVLEQCTFIDSQRAEAQEPLELLRGGEQAKRLSLWIESDLTNQLIPGDTVEITGVLRLQNPKARGSVYDKYLDVNSIKQMRREFEEMMLTKSFNYFRV